MSGLPRGWIEAQLGEVAKISWGNTSLTKKTYTDTGFTAFSATGPDGLVLVPEHEGPGIVLSAIGAGCGRCFKADGKWTAIKNTMTITEFSGEREYLFNFLNNADRWPKKGGAQPFITLGDARQLLAPIPPLAEQKRIVAALDALSAKSACARTELSRIETLVSRYKQAVLSKAFSGELTPLAVSNWTVCTLGALALDVRYGTAEKCAYAPELTPVLRIPNVANGRIDLSDLKHASFNDKELKKLALVEGDLLVIRSNGSLALVGRSAIVDSAAAGMLFAGYLIRLRLDKTRALPPFIQYWMQSLAVRRTLEDAAKSTSGVNNVNSQQLQALQLQLPLLEEQHEIVRRIETAFAKIDKLAIEAKRALTLLGKLDEAILAKAFRGELVSQDEADEPAEKLLERIRAERDVAPKVKRGRKGAELKWTV